MLCNSIFFERFVSSQIHGDRNQQVVSFAHMTSCAMRYDVTYHPFAINSQYLKTWGVDSPAEVTGEGVSTKN